MEAGMENFEILICSTYFLHWECHWLTVSILSGKLPRSYPVVQDGNRKSFAIPFPRDSDSRKAGKKLWRREKCLQVEDRMLPQQPWLPSSQHLLRSRKMSLEASTPLLRNWRPSSYASPNVEAALEALRHDGFVVLKSVVDVAHIHYLNSYMTKEADELAKNSVKPFNQGVKCKFASHHFRCLAKSCQQIFFKALFWKI